MADSLRGGASLADVFKVNEKIFGPICTSVLRVGEASGTLDKSLVFLSEYLEYSHDLSQEVSAALIYPKFITTLIFFVTAFLTGYILPKLVPIFKQLHVTLPLSTRILLAVSTFVRAHWILLIVAIVLLRILYSVLLRIPSVRLVFDRMILSLPLFGSLLKNYQLALFTQLFLTLFRSGSPVEGGMTFSKAISAEEKLFPNNIIAIVSAGEQSGSLEQSFKSLAEYYAKEVRLKTKKLPALIEPVLLVVIAFVVGFVALSIILPIYEVTRGITR
jgi:type IV pilus assembly protein PilC